MVADSVVEVFVDEEWDVDDEECDVDDEERDVDVDVDVAE